MIGMMLGEVANVLPAGIAVIPLIPAFPATNHPSGGAGRPSDPLRTLGEALASERDETSLVSSTPTGRFLRLFLVCLAVSVVAVMTLPQIM